MGAEPFRHEAFMYAGVDEFVAGARAFLDVARRAGAPALVMTDEPKTARLRAALGDGADAVQFADMAAVGRNPAQIIPAWRDFVAGHGDRPMWGIGEPVWAGRSPAELVECRHHEALINVSFADCAGLNLLCPYDRATLAAEVITGAHATHQVAGVAGGPHEAVEVDGLALLAEPLPDPPDVAVQVEFGGPDLAALRDHTRQLALAVGLDPVQAADVVLAVDEVATNSGRYGGGGGVMSSWIDGASLVFEVRDAGHLTDPLVGRRRPSPRQIGGRGLWIANQLCDLLQIRSSVAGTVVRLHKRLAAGR